MAKIVKKRKQPRDEAEILSELIHKYKEAIIRRANFPKYDDRKRRFLITTTHALEVLTPDDMDKIEPILYRTLGAFSMGTLCNLLRD